MNNFAITISAIDKATATVRKINGSISQLTRPVNQLSKSSKALGRELGIDKMAKSIGNVAKNAREAASTITKLGAPILAIIGGGSLLGIAALANEWAHLGAEVARTSKTLGVSAGELQSLRGAAQVAGVSSEELTGGLKAVGDTLEDALYGRNQNAAAVLNKLGIGIHKTATGAIDSTRALGDLADAISNIKSPQVQGVVARTFGVEALLPMLIKGRAGIAAYQRKVASLGGVMSDAQVERAKNFGIALSYLNVATTGLKNSIGDALIPAIQPLVEDLTTWIAANRDLIGAKVGEWAQDFAKWVRSIDFKAVLKGISDTIAKISDFVDSIGGWKVAAIAVAAIMAGPLLLSITNVGLGLGGLALQTIPVAVKALGILGTSLGGAEASAGLLTTALRGIGVAGAVAFAAMAGWEAGKGINWLYEKIAGKSIGNSIYDLMHPEESGPRVMQTGNSRGVVDFFKSKGWTEAQALGIAANLKQESGFNTDANGDGGKAYGVAQWHADRQANFQRWAGKPIRQASLEEQLGFVNYELTQGTEKGAGDALKGAADERQAASIVSRQYERPAAADAEAANRGNMAADMKHQFEITLHGLPAGTKATAQKRDGSTVPVRVSASNPSSMTP